MDLKITDIGIFILGNPHSLRNPKLNHLGKNVTFVPPVLVPASEDVSIRQYSAEFILNGRTLKRGERGCSLAHKNIRNLIASGSPYEWNLVLEDDADIPEDWFDKLLASLPTPLRGLAPGVILLNTNPYFDFGPKAKRLTLKPSLTNAYVIHRNVASERRFTNIEPLELADWPMSFCDVEFWSVSGIASDLGQVSTIGKRPVNRIAALISLIMRAGLSPLSARALSLPLRDYFTWAIFAPLKRDVALRIRQLNHLLKTRLDRL